MAQPTSTGGYDFEEDKTVAVGDPTEAVADHNTLAENTDWVRVVADQCWPGEWDQTDNTGFERNLNSNGKFTVVICKVVEQDTESVIIDVSSAANPFSTSTLKYRDFHLALFLQTTGTSESQALACVPGGSADSVYEYEDDIVGMFYSGAGTTGSLTSPSWKNAAATTYIWVDETTGDLKIQYAIGSGTGAFSLVRGYVEILPVWVEA